MLFSQRKGIKPIKSIIQNDSMDSDLRNGLWNALTIFYWDTKSSITSYLNSDYDNALLILCQKLWLNYFKSTLDSLNKDWSITHKILREYFLTCDWNEGYDFIEFVANNYFHDHTNQKFITYCNSILERELSAYRFVGGKITEITSKEEIKEVEEALVVTKSLKAVNIHLNSALDKFADRKSPDYRNSIKESISAVESICKLITNNPKAALGQCIKVIKEKVGLHPALEKAFNSLYGYTSDAEGIRHALLDKSTLDAEDAKFMLVSCSAFINYLISKSSKAGIKL